MQLKYTAVHLQFIIIILHTVGLIGIAIPYTRELTISLTPINLFLSLVILLIGSETSFIKILPTLLISFLIGLGVEILGVQTGFPFGEYSYGKVMGPQVLDTPLVIGINWFMLSYLFFYLTQNINSKTLRVLLASGLMTLMDVIIEPIAIKLNYWHWMQHSIPLSNYLAWFFISLIIQIIFLNTLKKDNNKIAFTLLFTQVAFFCLLYFADF